MGPKSTMVLYNPAFSSYSSGWGAITLSKLKKYCPAPPPITSRVVTSSGHYRKSSIQ